MRWRWQRKACCTLAATHRCGALPHCCRALLSQLLWDKLCVLQLCKSSISFPAMRW